MRKDSGICFGLAYISFPCKDLGLLYKIILQTFMVSLLNDSDGTKRIKIVLLTGSKKSFSVEYFETRESVTYTTVTSNGSSLAASS